MNKKALYGLGVVLLVYLVALLVFHMTYDYLMYWIEEETIIAYVTIPLYVIISIILVYDFKTSRFWNLLTGNELSMKELALIGFFSALILRVLSACFNVFVNFIEGITSLVFLGYIFCLFFYLLFWFPKWMENKIGERYAFWLTLCFGPIGSLVAIGLKIIENKENN